MTLTYSKFPGAKHHLFIYQVLGLANIHQLLNKIYNQRTLATGGTHFLHILLLFGIQNMIGRQKAGNSSHMVWKVFIRKALFRGFHHTLKQNYLFTNKKYYILIRKLQEIKESNRYWTNAELSIFLILKETNISDRR